MKKIIHITDTHIGARENGDTPCEQNFNVIVENIIALKYPANDYVIVHTGDIVDNAYDDKQWEVALILIQKLKDAGFLFLTCPGNHDYGAGINSDKQFVNIFKLRLFENDTITYPKLDIIDNVAFIGLDSMAEEVSWYDTIWAQGEIGIKQRNRLEQMLSRKAVKDCAYRVLYLHHHITPTINPLNLGLKLKDADKLVEIINNKKNVNVLLFGHDHDPRRLNGMRIIPRVARIYDGGTATKKGGKGFQHMVIDLNKDPRYDYDGKFL